MKQSLSKPKGGEANAKVTNVTLEAFARGGKSPYAVPLNIYLRK